jgi:glucosamine--fructose-6-phosphate aminotransferase (isomerizing)
MALIDEIREQPEVLRRRLGAGMDVVRRVAEEIHRRDARFVLIAARGSSDHAGTYAQYVLGARNRLPVALATPSLFTVYGSPPRIEDALVIGVSQSGRSPDIVSVVEEGRRQGALTLAITNAPDSPIAQAAELHLDILAGPERAVAATKTYTAQLMTLAALSVALAGSPPADLEALGAVPDAVAQALPLEARAREIVQGFGDIPHGVVLARGYNYATALEWSLKLKEMAYLFTDVYSTADFQHGPIAIVEPGLPILAVVPRGATYAGLVSLLAQVRDEHGTRLVVISDGDEALALSAHALRLPDGLPEWLTPIPAIVPAQLLTYHLTRQRGLDLEQPRTISKITLTR